MKITRPTFVVDKSKVLANLRRMKAKVDRVNDLRRQRWQSQNQSPNEEQNPPPPPPLLRFRPHCKTHASLEIGRWMKEEMSDHGDNDDGIDCITVSSLSMAKYFAPLFRDITVAFTVNILEIDTINELLLLSQQQDQSQSEDEQQERPFRLNLLVENVEAVQFLQQHVVAPVGIYIKIDVGYGRTGIPAQDTDRVAEVVRAILNPQKQEQDGDNNNTNNNNDSKLIWKGLLTHSGQSYDCTTQTEILKVYHDTKTLLVNLRSQLQSIFPSYCNNHHIEISIGDTPTCSTVGRTNVDDNHDDTDDWADGIDEIRPGNFVFYDVEQAEQIGCCDYNDIAVAVACPIVAIHCDRRELILYGGGVHLSKDRLTTIPNRLRNSPDDETTTSTTIPTSSQTIYGRVARSLSLSDQHHPESQVPSNLGWGDVIDGMYLRSTSQEHGIVVVPTTIPIESYHVGQIIHVLPIHSCMTADVMSHRGYVTTDGQSISRLKD